MPSFDVLSEADEHEVRNAVDQTAREMKTRYDFKGSKAEISLDGLEISMLADDDMRLKAVVEILKTKLAKRQVSLKLLEFDDAKPIGGDMIKQVVRVKNGLKDEELRKLTKLVKGSKIKVQPQIQGEQLRITGKKRDDLQEVIALLKEQASDLELQFSNFRD
ncbi:MAG: YajQ family cyclic di-GMP-binding protein [Bdellovibrionales bacterium]|nr:YajQ family cyclic di-GMP-binding protein [Bdellovibrionales bacterium]